MNSSIIKRLALALSLGIAPVGLALAQSDPATPPIEEEATVEGEAGVTVEDQTDAAAEGEAVLEDEAETTSDEAAEAPADEEETEAAAEGEADSAAEEEAGTAAAPAEEDEAGATAEGEATVETEAEAAAEAQDIDVEVTSSVNVTQEQRTQITQVVRDIDVAPVDIDFDLAVGTAIPTTSRLALHIVPQEIVTVVPQFRNHLHFVAADHRVVIVDPCTMQVVAIIA
jgi:hypothetical protein